MAVAISRTADPAGAAASSNIATYSAQSIGTAADDRVVCLAVCSNVASSGATHCHHRLGAGATMFAGTQGNQGALYARWFYLPWPTGTTAEFKLRIARLIQMARQNHVAVYRVVGCKIPTQAVVNDTDCRSHNHRCRYCS